MKGINKDVSFRSDVKQTGAAIAKRILHPEAMKLVQSFSVEYVLYYWAKMYAEKFKAGGKYEELEQTFLVNVLGFKFLNCEQYYSSYSIMEDSGYEKFTDHIFALSKVPKEMINSNGWSLLKPTVRKHWR